MPSTVPAAVCRTFGGLALRLGATHTHDLADGPLATGDHGATGGAMADDVFVVTGAPSALAGAAEPVGTMGPAVIVGMPASGISGMFRPRRARREEQRILGSRMGTSVIARDIPRLMQRYQDGELELDGSILRRSTLDRVDEAMDGVRSGAALRNIIVVD
jgi:S-(hydroxymethyl)glutathione dehydrogenase / alcohol dehydrogenase